MMRKNIINLLVIISITSSCDKIDNYDFPNGNIYGKLIDQITNENLQSEAPNGFNVKLFEKGGMRNNPIIFTGKPDGTFENALIFQNEYKVLPTEGAFFPVDTATVQVGARTEVSFEVMPYLAVTNVTVTPSSGQVTATYNIARNKVGDKIFERVTLVSMVNTVNNVVYNFRKVTSLTGTSDATVLATQYTDVLTGLTSGKTYWVRVAVRTNNALKRYNYSKPFQVTIP
jgi:hypothetical protein